MDLFDPSCYTHNEIGRNSIITSTHCWCTTRYYDWVLERTDEFIPEQIFDNEIQVSVSPLLWSHAMFVIASGVLGYL